MTHSTTVPEGVELPTSGPTSKDHTRHSLHALHNYLK
jgi:hypothetical protein